MRGKLERDRGQRGSLCSCFHLKLDSDHNVSSSLCALLSLVPLEGFPLSPFEETTALGFVSHFNLGGSVDGSVGVSGCGIISVQLAIC